MKKQTWEREVAEWGVYAVLGFVIAFGLHWGLGAGLNTNYPVVAVVSSSMEHDTAVTFENWLDANGFDAATYGDWAFARGIAKGDIVVVRGVTFEAVKPGDVIVYQIPGNPPVIHRVVQRTEENTLITKGDNNPATDQENSAIAPPIQEAHVQGRAVAHVPLLGYVKIGAITLTEGLT